MSSKNTIKFIIRLLLIATFVFLIWNFSELPENQDDKSEEYSNNSIIAPITSAVPASAEKYIKEKHISVNLNPEKYTLMFSGDMLTGVNILNKSYNGQTSQYNYDSFLQPGAELIKKENASLAICHLEILSSYEGPIYYRNGLSPGFTNPPNFIPELQKMGWDGCSAASNHSLDGGFSTIEDTVDIANENSFGLTGIASTEEQKPYKVYSLEGKRGELKVANISYTWALNGLSKPRGKDWSVNTFSRFDKNIKNIVDSAEEAKRVDNVDITVLSLHCCQEYSTQPSKDQIILSQKIADSGAVDILIGHHPHVPQPVRAIPANTNSGEMIVFYSLGNYVGDLNRPYSDIGLIAQIDVFKKPDTNTVVNIEPKYHTVRTVKNDNGFTVVINDSLEAIKNIMQ